MVGCPLWYKQPVAKNACVGELGTALAIFQNQSAAGNVIQLIKKEKPNYQKWCAWLKIDCNAI